jgi:hypothetical protein
MINKIKNIDVFKITEYSFYSLFMFIFLPYGLQNLTVFFFIFLTFFDIFKDQRQIAKVLNKYFLVSQIFVVFLLLSSLRDYNQCVGYDLSIYLYLILISISLWYFSLKHIKIDRKILINVMFFSVLVYFLRWLEYVREGIILYQNNINPSTNKIIDFPLLYNFNCLKSYYIIFIEGFLYKPNLFIISREAYSYFGEPEFFTHYAYISCYILILCFMMIFNLNSILFKKKLFYILALIFMISFLIYLNSIMNLIGLTIGLFLFFFFNLSTKMKFIMSMVVIIISIIFIQSNIDKFVLLENKVDLNSNKIILIDNLRLQLYENSISLFSQNPLLGYGVCAYKNLVNTGVNVNTKMIYNPHSQFIQIVLSSGIIGLIPMISFFILVIVNSLRKLDYFLLTITMVIILNLLFENFLDRQYGIFIYSFLFLFNYYKSHNGEK